MAKKSKRYIEQLAKVDRDAFYHPLDAVTLAKETSSDKYDATIDVAMRLSVGPRKGSAVFFAYTDAQSRTDPMSFHAGAPVTRGEKWIATRWMREREFT